LLRLLLLLSTEAESIIKEARAEVSTMVNKQKGEKQSELDKIYADAKAKVTRETEAAIAGQSVGCAEQRPPGGGG
jgi:F0F1-type ATP synthase membrane subunit b/b'